QARIRWTKGNRNVPIELRTDRESVEGENLQGPASPNGVGAVLQQHFLALERFRHKSYSIKGLALRILDIDRHRHHRSDTAPDRCDRDCKQETRSKHNNKS